jgi:uncharacterized protein (TIGR03546 family)
VFLFRIQLGAVFISMFFFKLLSPALTPLFHWTGDYILSLESLEPIFVILYNLPLVPFTRFYNTVVMGAGAVAVALVLPLFFLFRYLISQYRTQVVNRFKESRLWHLLKASTVYQWYKKYDSLVNS